MSVWFYKKLELTNVPKTYEREYPRCGREWNNSFTEMHFHGSLC